MIILGNNVILNTKDILKITKGTVIENNRAIYMIKATLKKKPDEEIMISAWDSREDREDTFEHLAYMWSRNEAFFEM